MTARSETIEIDIDGEQMTGHFLSPKSKVPGVLFVHGWGGSQERDLERAKGIAGLGCVCLTFDLRGHTGGKGISLSQVTREDNLRDLLAAYDRLLAHPALDTSAIAVVGTSYGGYLAAILTSLRPVRWLALRVPALYRDEQWHTPKRQLDKVDLLDYRSTLVHSANNRSACLLGIHWRRVAGGIGNRRSRAARNDHELPRGVPENPLADAPDHRWRRPFAE